MRERVEGYADLERLHLGSHPDDFGHQALEKLLLPRCERCVCQRAEMRGSVTPPRTAYGRPASIIEHREAVRAVICQYSRYNTGCQAAYRRALISPQTVCSLEVSPISMKYLHNCVWTTAARYQQIWDVKR